MSPQQRAAVVAEAEKWLRTPWHHGARVLGAGVDCGQLLVAAYAGAGLVESFDTGPYPPDYMLHQSDELFLAMVQRWLVETDRPLPGDVAIWKYGRCYSHGAIIKAWPIVVHAYRPEGSVGYGDASKGKLACLPVRFFTGEGRLA